MKPAICNNNLQANIKAFREGKRDFNPQELNDIKLYLLKYKDHLESTQFFTGSLQEYSVASCFANNFQEELLDHMINKLQAAISIVVVMDENRNNRAFLNQLPNTKSHAGDIVKRMV